ncbi:Hypothetical_protein [Hexamita inflata]|uniref:Hypothetical_protein n=1 Tax=Hexamita inflata TaxID=28002 RepID=A0AA86TAB0_9EUKA|nr:Hypothetical protein HINF_LOCUS1109 [Hexamita inflata]
MDHILSEGKLITTYSTAQLSCGIRNSDLPLRYSKKRKYRNEQFSQINQHCLLATRHWIIVLINYNVWVAIILKIIFKVTFQIILLIICCGDIFKLNHRIMNEERVRQDFIKQSLVL